MPDRRGRNENGVSRTTRSARSMPKGGLSMTTLGKILVIVNLVFSLVTGALIIMVFVGRTNWKKAYDDMDAQAKAIHNSGQAYANETVQLRNDFLQKEAQIQAQVVNLDGDNKKLKEDNTNLNTELKAANKKADEARIAQNEATAELARRKSEVESLQKIVTDKEKKLNDIEVQNKDFRDRAVSAEINFKAEHERKERLLEQLEKMSKEFEKAQATKVGGTGVAGAGKKPPPEDVKGKIDEIDPQYGLVTISIGSDSGLSAGHTLEVYRLDPKAEYVGTIRIVEVDFKHAVARAVNPLRAGPLRKGDIVASRIVAH
jgi:hypothetical protein